MLQEMGGKAMPQRMWRNVRNSCFRRMLLDYGPGILSRQRAPSVKKQVGLGLAAQPFANSQVLLQILNRTLANGHAPLLVSLPVTSDQSRMNVNIADMQIHNFRNAHSGGIHQLEQRAISHTLVGRYIRR